ncbi:MAG: sugar ABC transporter permease [Oscillospiraceae bacterium]|jgi:putative aldouronate transport system permease protein|nr:sugar ABC transporter permease [Oscillospiraceae bacterium]
MTKQKRQSRTKLFLKRFSKQKYIFMLVVPGVIWFIVFKYYPLRFIINAFTNYGTVANPRFTGLANFQRLFLSPNFWRAFRNTLILSFYNIVFYFPIPIILALSLNELKNQFAKKAAQFVIYIPHFLSWVVVGGLFNMMLAPSDGIINKALISMGIISEPIYFMASVKWFRSVLVGTEIWKSAGYGAVIYIAAISSIDTQLYDAAAVDGAGYWARTWHVTLPGIRNTIATVLLLTLSRVMQMFEQILVMYNSAVMDVSDVLRTFSYVEGLNRGNVGYATAIGLFTSIVSVLLILGCNLFSKKVLDEEII